jgi:hypothetical protein
MTRKRMRDDPPGSRQTATEFSSFCGLYIWDAFGLLTLDRLLRSISDRYDNAPTAERICSIPSRADRPIPHCRRDRRRTGDVLRGVTDSVRYG